MSAPARNSAGAQCLHYSVYHIMAMIIEKRIHVLHRDRPVIVMNKSCQNLAPKSSQPPRIPKHLISLLYILLVPETS